MTQVTLNIPDDQYRFFMELISKLTFVQMETNSIPNWHIETVNQRLAEHQADPSTAIDWETAKRELESDL